MGYSREFLSHEVQGSVLELGAAYRHEIFIDSVAFDVDLGQVVEIDLSVY